MAEPNHPNVTLQLNFETIDAVAVECYDTGGLPIGAVRFPGLTIFTAGVTPRMLSSTLRRLANELDEEHLRWRLEQSAAADTVTFDSTSIDAP